MDQAASVKLSVVASNMIDCVHQRVFGLNSWRLSRFKLKEVYCRKIQNKYCEFERPNTFAQVAVQKVRFAFLTRSDAARNAKEMISIILRTESMLNFMFRASDYKFSMISTLKTYVPIQSIHIKKRSNITKLSRLLAHDDKITVTLKQTPLNQPNCK